MLIPVADHNNNNDSSDLCKVIEVKLEHIVDNLLLSNVNGDNILLDIHHTIEKIFIASAMRLKNNNITQAARLLGINRNTLSKKLKELDGSSDR